MNRRNWNQFPHRGTILGFGDSLTVGFGTTAANSYPSILAQLSGRAIINGGISGETSAQGLERLPQFLAETAPELLLLLKGGNDILRNHDPAQTKRNLRHHDRTCSRYRHTGSAYCSTAEEPIFQPGNFYRVLADQYQLVLIDDLIADLLRTPGYKSDAIHFDAQGYRELAEQVYSVLKKQGALQE